MASQYSLKEHLTNPEFEYHAEELRKRMQNTVANFAQIRFKRAMQMRMAVLEK